MTNDYRWVFDHSTVDWTELSELYRMNTAMAIWRDPDRAIASGLIGESP